MGGKFLFHCNFNLAKLLIALLDFYKECVLTWSSLNKYNPSSLPDIVNQVVWSNRFICVDSRSVYNAKLFDVGLIKIGKMARSKSEEPWHSSLSLVELFLILRLLSAFPLEWSRELKLNKAYIYANTQHQIPSDFFLRVDGNKSSLEKPNSKSLYQSFRL